MYPRQVHPREENSVAWPVTLMVHVGPHKTGTTTIQAALGHNTSYLSTRGVHVPPGVHPDFGGHHLLPFLLAGRTLIPLGMRQSDVSVGDLLVQWLTDARENAADRILVSSEAFVFVDEKAWQAFDHELREAAALTNTVVSRIVIHFTSREIESRLTSVAGNAYIQGATLSWEDLIEWLRVDLSRQDATIERLPGLLTTPTEVSHIDFAYAVATPHSPAAGPTSPPEDFAQRWFAHVLGAEEAEGMVIAQESARLNPSLSRSTLNELREFNVLNNPPHAEAVWPFAKFDGDPELERAFERLSRVRLVFMARDTQAHLVQDLRTELAMLSEKRLRSGIRRFFRRS